MTEDPKAQDVNQEQTSPESQGEEAPQEEARPDAEAAAQIGTEFQQLLVAFSRAAQAAWNSEQRKELETDLNRGLRTLVDNVETLIKQFGESEPGQELRERAEHAVEKVRRSPTAAEIEATLAKGLHTVVAELREVAERLEQSKAEEAQSAGSKAAGPEAGETAPAQDIPIEEEE